MGAIGADYAVNGYASAADDAALRGASGRSIASVQGRYCYVAAAHTVADEHFGGNPYQYVPTTLQVIAAQAALQMTLISEKAPTQALNTPAGVRLVQALYSQANALYAELARATELGIYSRNK